MGMNCSSGIAPRPCEARACTETRDRAARFHVVTIAEIGEAILMSFRELSTRVLEPLSMYTMIFGIVALCQPWVEVLHRYGITVTLIGLVGFSVFSKIKPIPKEE